MSKPARPDLKFTSIEQMLADAQALRAGPYEKAGQWDLPMILDHLTKTMSLPLAPAGRNLPWPLGALARVVIHRFAQRKMYPTMKFPAPRHVRPAPNVGLETAWAEFQTAAGRLLAHTGNSFTVTPFGQVPREDFIKIQLLHGAHHLSFLKLV
jgi:hypothetical protein